MNWMAVRELYQSQSAKELYTGKLVGVKVINEDW